MTDRLEFTFGITGSILGIIAGLIVIFKLGGESLGVVTCLASILSLIIIIKCNKNPKSSGINIIILSIFGMISGSVIYIPTFLLLCLSGKGLIKKSNEYNIKLNSYEILSSFMLIVMFLILLVVSAIAYSLQYYI